jgi:hypothetical protein
LPSFVLAGDRATITESLAERTFLAKISFFCDEDKRYTDIGIRINNNPK